MKMANTFFIEDFGGLVLEEAVTGFLADLEADGVFGLLGFLEKLGDLFNKIYLLSKLKNLVLFFCLNELKFICSR